MKDHPDICVELAGGLGNQIFQLAAGLAYLQAPADSLELDWNLGKPRLNSKGLPALCDYIVPDGIKIRKKNLFSYLGSKSFGYLIRMGSMPRSFEKLRLVKLLITALGSWALVLYFKANRTPVISNDLGYSGVEIPKKRILLVGYFQSYRYFLENGVIEKLRKMELVNPSKALLDYQKMAKEDKPLVVHFRLGDYLTEENFGIPDENYYREAITALWRTGEYKKIWVFSDDIDIAKTKFPQEFVYDAKWIEPVSASAAENLEIMRLGQGFVIANSTFSYWAATLSHFANAKVIAPNPWFKKLDSPKDLLPPAWRQVSAWTVQGE